MKNEVTTSIISVGDEILVGQTVDTNSTFIAGKLSSLGIRVAKIMVVADNPDEITRVLDEAVCREGIVIMTGGLGPTNDDLTRPVLANYFEMELEHRPDILERIEARFKDRGIEMPRSVEVQAEFPRGAEPIENNFGTAPGIFIRRDDCLLFSLPGVPREMRGMLDDFVIPLLQREGYGSARMFRVVRTSGAGETTISQLIGENFPAGVEIAYLPKYFGVDLRLTVEASDEETVAARLEQAESYLNECIGDYIYSYGDEQLAEIIGRIMRANKWRLALAESCTGGLLGSMITDIPGASDYFNLGFITYSNAAKQDNLNVSSATMEKYGAVSSPTAMEMAVGAKERAESDFALAVTGIAGPTGGDENKPVGTVYIALAHPEGVEVNRFNFRDDRRMNRHRSAYAALNMLYRRLKQMGNSPRINTNKHE